MPEAAEQTMEQYAAEVGALANQVATLCDGKPMGVVTLALFNGLVHIAEHGGAELRALMLQSIPELAANIEAMDAARH